MLNLNRRAVALAFAGVLLATAGAASAQQTVIIEKAMPAPIVETVPAPPRVGVAWVPGHWVWRGRAWFWVRGHYVEGVVPPMPAVIVETPPPAPSPRHNWVRGHWAWEGARWNWRPGIWIHL